MRIAVPRYAIFFLPTTSFLFDQNILLSILFCNTTILVLLRRETMFHTHMQESVDTDLKTGYIQSV